VILVLDTASARSAVAVLDGGRVEAERVEPSGRSFDIAAVVASIVDVRRTASVAIGTGPGSFTGLRIAAAYGTGLALGLRVPLLGLPTLALQAARAGRPARGVSEAGRGRVYFAAADEDFGVAAPGDMPRSLPAVGWLRPATAGALRDAGVQLLPENELRSFGYAALELMPQASELGYGTFSLEYASSFGTAT
jgi:tRNA threonylcarbamoyladenosine biosynthesis protein TsaB